MSETVDDLVRVLLPRLKLPEGIQPKDLLDESMVPPPRIAAKVLALRALIRNGGRDDALVGILTSSHDVARYFMPRLRSNKVETFWVVGLNGRNEVISVTEAGRGGPTTCVVAASTVFRPLILNGAVSVIMVHNHPSGDPMPSPEDIALTRTLGDACELFNMRLLDHVVVAKDGWVSMLDQGLMKGEK